MTTQEEFMDIKNFEICTYDEWVVLNEDNSLYFGENGENLYYKRK